MCLLILVQSISPQHGSKEDNSSKNRFRNPAAQPLPSTQDEVLPGQGSPYKHVTSNAPSPYNASMIPLCILNSNTMCEEGCGGVLRKERVTLEKEKEQFKELMEKEKVKLKYLTMCIS